MICCSSNHNNWNEWNYPQMPVKLYDVYAGKCLWKTSHNSFMPSLPVGRASRNEIVRVLSNGYRVIELDLHERKGGVEISHGIWSNGLGLRDVLNDIDQHAFRGSDYPLVITCDSSVRSQASRELLESEFKHVFGQRILGRQGMLDFYTASMEELKSKIIICSYETQLRAGLGNISALNFNREVHNTSINGLPDTNSFEWSLLTPRTGYQIVRTYPKNTICSDNPDPSQAIKLGVQWIALNDQTRNKHFGTVNRLFQEGPIVLKE